MARENRTAKKEFTFGTCSYQKTSPPQTTLSAETKVLNILVCFEDALKLNIAIDECLRQLNSYNRSYRAGKNAALQLTIHLDKKRITVNEGRLPAE